MPRQKLTQRADGRYSCKYHGKTFYGATAREAQQKRDEYRRLEEAGLRAAAAGLTVRQYAMQWLPTHKASVSDKCYNDYAKQLNAMLAIIGDKRLLQVTPDDIKSIFTTHYLGFSQSTIKRARMLYVSMFDAAVESGYARSNPCRSKHAQPHKGTVGTHRAITDEERDLILRTPHRFRLGALVMLYAGLRRGEVLALRRSDIDTDSAFIHVSRAVRYDSNQPIIVDPKTEAGERDIPLLSQLAAALPNACDIIMPSARDTICSQIEFKRGWDSYLHALSKAAGYDVFIRPHDLRHSYCTMLRDAGVEMKLAMQWMGHADEKMILRIYDHVTTDRIDHSVQLLEDNISRQNGRQPRHHTPQTREKQGIARR